MHRQRAMVPSWQRVVEYAAQPTLVNTRCDYGELTNLPQRVISAARKHERFRQRTNSVVRCRGAG